VIAGPKRASGLSGRSLHLSTNLRDFERWAI
jgi:hypothetical protein